MIDENVAKDIKQELDNLSTITKQGLEREAQTMKDTLIDDIIRRVNQFTIQWQDVIARVAKTDEIKQKSDKLNPDA